MIAPEPREPDRAPTQEMSVADALQLALAMHRDGEHENAESLYRRILAVAPDQVDALHFLALLQHQRGKSDEALRGLARVLELRPDYLDARNNLGNVLKETRRLAEAECAYREVIRRDPKHAQAHNNLGLVCKIQGRLDEALAEYSTALELDPHSGDVHYNIGTLYQRLGRKREAIGHFNMATILNPRHPESRKLLGIALYSLGKIEEATEVFQEWADLEPENPTARHLLAACSGRNPPPRAPDDYIQATFDRFAATFDERLADLEYRAPELVAAALAAVLSAPDARLEVLDAGCGTGLCSAALRPFARRLIGVDLSGGMLERAHALGRYDQLIQAELTAFLAPLGAEFDVIASADTLVYFGPLDAVLTAAARALRPGGWLCFTVEKSEPADAPAGYRIHPHGRYSHTERYLRDVLGGAGMEVVSMATGTLRKEGAHPVAGHVVLARRS